MSVGPFKQRIEDAVLLFEPDPHLVVELHVLDRAADHVGGQINPGHAVEPHPGNQLQGLKSLADGFIPPILDLAFLDGKILVRSGQAFRAARLLMEREGIFGGVSAGAVLHAGLRFAERIDKGNIVLVFADSGWKYLDTNLWSRELTSEEDEENLDDIIWW